VVLFLRVGAGSIAFILRGSAGVGTCFRVATQPIVLALGVATLHGVAAVDQNRPACGPVGLWACGPLGLLSNGAMERMGEWARGGCAVGVRGDWALGPMGDGVTGWWDDGMMG